jgi:hypothetical protein
MPKGTVTCNNILGLYYNATAIANIADNASASPITSVYVQLHSATPGASGTQATNEASFTDSARVATARGTGGTGWSAPSGGAISNNGLIQGPVCGVTGQTQTYVSTGKGASGATDIFHFGALNDSLAVSLNIRWQFDAGGLTVTET